MSTILAWRVVRHGRVRGARAAADPRADPRPRPGARACARERLQLQRGGRLLRPLPHDRSAAAVHARHGDHGRGGRGRRRRRALARPARDGLRDRRDGRPRAVRARGSGDDVRGAGRARRPGGRRLLLPVPRGVAGAPRARPAPREGMAARARRRGWRGLGGRAARRRARRARDRDGRLRREAGVLPRARRRGRARLPQRRPRGRAARRDRGPRRGRGLRSRRRRHRARDRARDGARRSPRDGGLLGRDRGRGPARAHAARDPVRELLARRRDARVPGDGATKLGPVNLLPRSLGDALQAELLRLLGEKRIRPIVGRTASYRELPAELERLESRATIGRSVLDWR